MPSHAVFTDHPPSSLSYHCVVFMAQMASAKREAPAMGAPVMTSQLRAVEASGSGCGALFLSIKSDSSSESGPLMKTRLHTSG